MADIGTVFASSERVEEYIFGEADRDGDILIGEHGDEKFGRLSIDQLAGGLLVSGIAGSGKTTVLTNTLLQLISDGHGVCYIDTKGSEAKQLLARIPADRMDDVVLLGEIGGQTHPLDLLEVPDGKPSVSPSVLSGLFTPMLRDADQHVGPAGHRLLELAGTAANELGVSPFAVEDIVDRDEEALHNLDIGVDGFASELGNADTQDALPASIITRLHRLGQRPVVDRMFQPDGVSLYEAVANEKIIIASVPGVASHEVTQTVANGLIAKIHEVLQFYATMGAPPANLFPLAIDEVDRLNLNEDITNGWTTDSYRTNSPLIAALQQPQQLRQEYLRRLYESIQNYVSFSLSPEDAVVENMLALDAKDGLPDHLADLPRMRAVARFRADDPAERYHRMMYPLKPIEPRHEEKALRVDLDSLGFDTADSTP